MANLKHIPVSEQVWKQLGKIKEAGQTYNQLLQLMIWEINKSKLAEEFEKADKGEGEWYSLDEIK